MGYDEKMLLIRNYDLWAHITDEEYEALNIVHNFLEKKKNEYVYFEAQHHRKLYFIKDGFIKIGYIDEEGKEVVREILRKGDIFGQITLEENNLMGEYALAYKNDVSLCAFSVTDFEMLLKKKPELALKYSRQVGSKLRAVENRLVNLLHKDVRTRLLRFLIDLVTSSAATASPAGHSLPSYLTHEDIAQMIGSSRQTVTTLINEWEAEGWLIVKGRQLIIPDVKKLQKAAGVA